MFLEKIFDLKQNFLLILQKKVFKLNYKNC